MQVDVPITGPFYSGRASNVDCQELINLRVEIDNAQGKAVLTLVNRHCLEDFCTLGASPIRGMVEEKGFGYVVSGSRFYKVANDGTQVELGTLLTNSGMVGVASNGFDIFVCDGPYGYNYAIDSDTWTQDVENTPNGSGFTGGDTVTFIDQYLVANVPSSGVAECSGLADGTKWSALDTATAEGDPDNLIRVMAVHGDLWLMGDRTAEPYYNAYYPVGFPFGRRGGFIDMGLAARWSAATMDNTLYWLAKNRDGYYGVVRATGVSTEKVSTPAIDYQIGRMSTMADAVAWTFSDEGHSFYVITFPTGNKTFVFDAAVAAKVGMNYAWSEWRSSGLGRFRCGHHIVLNNQHIVGDLTTGKLYRLKQDIYDDAGDTVECQRTTQYLHKSGREVTVNKLWIEFESGVGLVSGQGEDPVAMLQFSKDGGHRWSNEHWASIGKMGEYTKRAMWTRLGSAPSWTFRIKVTDPVKVVVVAGYAEIELGDN